MYVLSQLERRYSRDHAPESFLAATGKGFLESFEKIPFGPLLIRWIEWVHAKV